MVACGGVVESHLQAAVRLHGSGMRLEALAIPDVNTGKIGLVACVASTVLPRGTGFSTCISRRIPANSGRIGMVVMRGKRHRSHRVLAIRQGCCVHPDG